MKMMGSDAMATIPPMSDAVSGSWLKVELWWWEWPLATILTGLDDVDGFGSVKRGTELSV